MLVILYYASFLMLLLPSVPKWVTFRGNPFGYRPRQLCRVLCFLSSWLIISRSTIDILDSHRYLPISFSSRNHFVIFVLFKPALILFFCLLFFFFFFSVSSFSFSFSLSLLFLSLCLFFLSVSSFSFSFSFSFYLYFISFSIIIVFWY